MNMGACLTHVLVYKTDVRVSVRETGMHVVCLSHKIIANNRYYSRIDNSSTPYYVLGSVLHE